VKAKGPRSPPVAVEVGHAHAARAGRDRKRLLEREARPLPARALLEEIEAPRPAEDRDVGEPITVEVRRSRREGLSANRLAVALIELHAHAAPFLGDPEAHEVEPSAPAIDAQEIDAALAVELAQDDGSGARLVAAGARRGGRERAAGLDEDIDASLAAEGQDVRVPVVVAVAALEVDIERLEALRDSKEDTARHRGEAAEAVLQVDEHW
jgi:hypothetical protein